MSMEVLERETEKKTVWCAIYTRKSTDENLNTDFNSLDSQRHYCESFINARGGEGWKVYPEKYDDPGFSGGNMNRPGLAKLLADARQGKIQVVVAYKYDRLTRNTKDFLQILEAFDKQKVAFVSVTQAIDTSSSIGRLMRSILMDFAQFEREMISERTRDKMMAMAKRGKRTGGTPVLGYDIDRDTKKLKVNTKEADIVRDMFHTYLVEKSLSATAHSLNRRSRRLKQWITRKDAQRGGGLFNKTNLSFMLRNSLYLGKVRYRGQEYPGEHEAILDQETFKKVQELLMKNNEKKKSECQDMHDFLLRGLLRCAVCGSCMTPNFSYSRLGQRYFYYKCTAVNRMDKTACSVASVPARALEQFVLERIEVLSKDKEVVAKIIATAQTISGDELPRKRQEKSVVSAELGKVEAEGKNWTVILGQEGPESPRRDFLMERLDELGKKRKNLQERLILLESDIAQLETRQMDAELVQQLLGNFLNVFKGLTPKEQKEYIRLLVKEVIYDGAKSEITLGLYPIDLIRPMEAFGVNFDQSTRWLPGLDSNQNYRLQRAMCYRYTTRE